MQNAKPTAPMPTAQTALTARRTGEDPPVVRATRRATQLDVSRILVDPGVVDKAEALSVYIKHNHTSIQTKRQSCSPADGRSAKAAASESKRRPPQFSSNFHRVKSPPVQTWRLAGGYDPAQAQQEQPAQVSGDLGPNAFHQQGSDELEWTKDQGTQLPSGEFPQHEQPSKGNNIVDSKASSMMNVVSSPERGSKSIIDALLQEDEPPEAQRQLHKSSHPDAPPAQRPPQTRVETDKLRLDLSTINKAHSKLRHPTVIAHEQLQSEQNAPTTERGYGEHLDQTCNESKNFSRMSTKSLPGAKKGQKALAIANIERSKGSMPECIMNQQLSNKSSICKLQAARNRNMHKQNSQVYGPEGKDAVLVGQRVMSGGQQTVDDECNLIAYMEVGHEKTSPNAIERNVMRSIEQELFTLQQSRRHHLDPKMHARQDYYNMTVAQWVQQVLRPFDFDERAERHRLKFMLTGEDDTAERSSFQSPSACAVGYTAYSKTKKESQRHRSRTPHVLSQLTSLQIKPKLHLLHQPESTFKHYPTLLSPVKQSMEPQRPESQAKVPATTRASVGDSELIFQSHAYESMEKQLPSNLEIKVHNEQRPENVQQQMERAEQTEEAVLSLTSRDLAEHNFLYAAPEQCGGTAQTDRIDLTKLDHDPVNMHRFEKLVMKLNPFSMNQIQKLSPKNNQVIDKFMDAKKWQKLQQVNQLQFDRALKSVIQNWGNRRNSSPIQSEGKEEKSTSRVRDRETPIQPVLQSKLSDKIDVETQGVERGRDSQRSRFSKLSERLLDREKRIRQRHAGDQQRKSSEQSTMVNVAPQKILFKTHIKVSPVDSKSLPERQASKQSSIRHPIKIQSRRANDPMKEFSKGMVKIDQILRNQPELNFESINGMPQGVTPIDLEQLKYKLDKRGADDLVHQALLQIHAIDGSSRNQVQSQAQTPTSVGEPLSHRIDRSARQQANQSEGRHKETQVTHATPVKSSNSPDRTEVFSQTTLARKPNPSMLSLPKKASSSIMSNAAFSFNQEGKAGASKRQAFPRKPRSVFSGAHSGSQNQDGNRESKMTTGKVSRSDVNQQNQQQQQDGEKQKARAPRLALGRNAGLREQKRMKINEWTHESGESNDVKSPSNTITFGSNNPKSRDSQRRMHVTGRQIKSEAETGPIHLLHEKGDADALSKVLYAAEQIDVPQLVQHVAAMRKIQIREKEKDLQKIKDLLKQFQTHGIDKGSFTMHQKMSQTPTGNAQAANVGRKTYMATVHLGNRQPDHVFLHADAETTKAREEEMGQNSASTMHINQVEDKQRAMEFLQRKYLARRQAPNLQTSQGARHAPPSPSIEKHSINQDLSSLDAKAGGLRHRSVLPPMTSQPRQRYNHGLLLQPLRQNSQLKSMEHSKILERAKVAPAHQTLYQRIVNKDDEECSRSSNAQMEGADATAQPQIQQARRNSQHIQNKASGVQGRLSPTPKKAIGPTSQKQSSIIKPKQGIKTDVQKEEVELASDPAETRTQSALAVKAASRQERKHGSTLASEPQSEAAQLQDGELDKIGGNCEELKGVGAIQNRQKQKPPHPLPDNVIIQVEESFSGEALHDSKTQVTAEAAPFDTSSLGHQRGTLHQCSWENQILSKGTAEDSALSGNEIQRRLMSPDVKITLQSSRQKRKRQEQRRDLEMQKQELRKDRSSMVVQGNAPTFRNTKQPPRTQHGPRVSAPRDDSVKVPVRDTRTAEPSKSYLVRQGKLYQNFRKQKNMRRDMQAIHSQKRSSAESSLLLNSTIINYQSPRNHTPLLYSSVFPAVTEAQKYYATVANQNINVDVLHAEEAGSETGDTPLRQATVHTEAMHAAAVSGQGRPAQQAPEPLQQRTNHQMQISELHKMASKCLGLSAQDPRLQKPGIVQLDLYPKERQAADEQDRLNFTQRLRQASKAAAQQSSNRPMAQELAASFRSYQTKHRLPPKLDDLIRTQRLAVAATPGPSSTLNSTLQDHLNRLPATNDSDQSQRLKQIPNIRGFTPLLGGKINSDGTHSFIYSPMQAHRPVDVPSLNLASATLPVPHNARGKPGPHPQHTASSLPKSSDRRLYDELFSDQAIAKLQREVVQGGDPTNQGSSVLRDSQR